MASFLGRDYCCACDNRNYLQTGEFVNEMTTLPLNIRSGITSLPAYDNHQDTRFDQLAFYLTGSYSLFSDITMLSGCV